MNCPTCGIALLISERQGIEIDYCRKCRGIWLDRGELDKLIERADSIHSCQENNRRIEDDDGDDDEISRRSRQSGIDMGRNRERKNPIGEIFDFF